MPLTHYWHQLKSWRYTRILLGGVSVSLAAYALVSLFPLLSVLQGVILAVLGFLALYSLWKSPSPRTVEKRPAYAQIMAPITLLGAVGLGSLWGALSATSLRSVLAGSVILALAALVWRWYAVVDQQQINARWAWLSILGAFVAYLATALWRY